MVNPSLKAQIEAAKSALASDLTSPSLVVPPPKPPTTPIMECSDTGTGANATNAADLDERITRLEAKLSNSQRDLHTLLQKIREVSRLQANSGQGHKNSANNQVKNRNQRSPVIMVAVTSLIGLVVGIAYFLLTAKSDLSALTVPSWIAKFIDSFTGWIG